MNKLTSSFVRKLRHRYANIHRLELRAKAKVTRSHIPVSRRSLIRKLLAKFPEYEHEKLLTLFSHIDASIQNNSRPYTLRLKDLYDPLNPDKDTVKIRQDISIVEQQELLMGHLRPLLQKAKYEKLPDGDLNRLSHYVELPERGLQVRCNVNEYALAEIWWKGEAHIDETRGIHYMGEEISSLKRLEFYYYEWMDSARRYITKHIQGYVAKWIRATPMDDDHQYQRLVIVLRKRNNEKLLIKSFKFIPQGSLQSLFPENEKRMGSLNSIIMYSTFFGSMSALLYNQYTGKSSEMMWPLGILLYRLWYNYDYRKKRYDSTLAQLLYNNNLGNNVGVILEIIDRAESEAFTSSILLYSALYHEATMHSKSFDSTGRSLVDVDTKIEKWIHEFSNIKNPSFDEHTALENLMKYNIIQCDEAGKMYIQPIQETIDILNTQRQQKKLVYSKEDINDSSNSLYQRTRLADDFEVPYMAD